MNSQYLAVFLHPAGVDTHHICNNSSYIDLNAPPAQQWQAVTIILFEHKLQGYLLIILHVSYGVIYKHR